MSPRWLSRISAPPGLFYNAIATSARARMHCENCGSSGECNDCARNECAKSVVFRVRSAVISEAPAILTVHLVFGTFCHQKVHSADGLQNWGAACERRRPAAPERRLRPPQAPARKDHASERKSRNLFPRRRHPDSPTRTGSLPTVANTDTDTSVHSGI